MLLTQRKNIASLFVDAIANVVGSKSLPIAPTVMLERPKVAAHGDIASSVALQLAKALRMDSRQLAQQLADAVLAHPDRQGLIESIEVAGPGFINLRLCLTAKQAVITAVLTEKENFGHTNQAAGQRVLLEFVSANPTGPLHVGHGRQAILGDTLANLLQTQGWQVQREFYYNDAGVQIDNLARSVQARARGLSPGDAQWPEASYHGEYITDIAHDYMNGAIVAAQDRAPVIAAANVDDLNAIRHFAVAYLRREQDLDLKVLGVRFDQYYLESSLYANGRVKAVVEALIAAGKTYEQDGALWLRAIGDGDDKDRVMRKSDGTYTYFVPDIAYHITKWERGFTKAINVQGTDHHGVIARVRAGLQSIKVGIPKDYPTYVLHQMVTVMRAGQEIKLSKRAGSYLTVRDLIELAGGKTQTARTLDADSSDNTGNTQLEEVMQRGKDAVRFFLISRKAETEFVFDIDLALKQSDENPVYYIQYAHARICSVLAHWAEDPTTLVKAALTPLTGERETALLNRLAEYPSMLARAADELVPHAIAFYLRHLAGEFHSFYNAERILVDDAVVRTARLALLAAIRQVLVNGLSVLGVSAPTSM